MQWNLPVELSHQIQQLEVPDQSWPIKTRKKKAKTQPRCASNSQNLNAKFCGSEFLKSSWKFVMMKALKLVWFQNGKKVCKAFWNFSVLKVISERCFGALRAPKHLSIHVQMSKVSKASQTFSCSGIKLSVLSSWQTPKSF